MPTTIILTGAAGDGDLANTANYSPAQLPVNGDTLIVEENGEDFDANLDALSGVTLAALVIRQSFTGTLGTASEYFQVSPAVVRIGEHYGPGSRPGGSQRIMLDTESANSTITVFDSAAASPSGDTDLPPIRLLVNGATADLFVRKGKVGVACVGATETATLRNIDLGFVASRDSDANLLLGPGVTWTAITMSGGSCVVQSAGTSITQQAGALLTEGSGAIGTVTVRGGVATLNATGTITTLAADGGVIDLTKSNAARTVTNLTSARGAVAEVRYDPAVVTVTNKLAPTGPVIVSIRPAS